METKDRWTKKDNNGKWISKYDSNCGYTLNCEVFGNTVDRLAAYEDTGLSPEEVVTLKSENASLRARLELDKIETIIAARTNVGTAENVRADIKNTLTATEELSTAEKLLWLVENKYYPFIHFYYNGQIGLNIGIGNQKELVSKWIDYTYPIGFRFNSIKEAVDSAYKFATLNSNISIIKNNYTKPAYISKTLEECKQNAIYMADCYEEDNQ